MNNKLPLKTIYAWYVVAVLMVCYTFSFAIVLGVTAPLTVSNWQGSGILRND